MSQYRIKVIVAGHICIDIIPEFKDFKGKLESLLAPGKLIEVGPVTTSTGGAVSNTGIALHKLGIKTKLIGKIGDDLFGRAILDKLEKYDVKLTDGMMVKSGEQSSYSVVVSPPGVDRIFFHCPGANNTFTSNDLDLKKLSKGDIFHFGYPPVMRAMFVNKGLELKKLMKGVKETGLTTSLDMSYPDPDSEAGKVDWEIILKRVLPYVDLFLPSLEETLCMLKHPIYETISTSEDISSIVNGDLLNKISKRLLNFGALVVLFKMGKQGLYVRTTSNEKKLYSTIIGSFDKRDSWVNRELLCPCFLVDLVGATGAGDSTIAGFLTGLVRGLSLEKAIKVATASGAFSVESSDATSGIPDWNSLQKRINSGWEFRKVDLHLEGWKWDDIKKIWIGTSDKK